MKITNKSLKKMSKSFNQSKKNKLAKNVVSHTKLHNLLINRDKQQKLDNVFSNVVDIDTDISVADQDNSGRCWIFSFLNMMRYKMQSKYNIKNFEFSYAYIYFYDKLEKCNYFLNTIYDTRKEKLNSRLIKHFLFNGINDGGNWNMFVNIINKYGVVPKSSFKESYQSNNSETINTFINNKLREYAHNIRKTGNKKIISKYMNEIYKILVICIGEPPDNISWKYYRDNKKNKKKYQIVEKITPIHFYKKHVPFNVDDMLVLIDNPCEKYNNKITINYFNNMVDGVPIEYLNVPNKLLKDCVKKSIDSNDVVAFGCDVDKYLNSTVGVLDLEMIDYKSLFDTDLVNNKCLRLDYLISDVTHAMIFRGYHKENKTIKKYLVENSWGKTSGIDGYLFMSDSYFKEYVYQIVIDKKYVPKKIQNILSQPAIILNPWDPFGNLLLN